MMVKHLAETMHSLIETIIKIQETIDVCRMPQPGSCVIVLLSKNPASADPLAATYVDNVLDCPHL